MKFVVWVLGVIVVLLLVGVIPAGEGTPATVFRSPVFIALLGTTAIAALVSCIVALWSAGKRRRFNLKAVCFLLTHFSVALILTGAFLRYTRGESATFVIPLVANHTVRSSYDGESQLDFGVTADELKISYYELEHYNLFTRTTGQGQEHADHEFLKKVSIPADGPLVVDEKTSVSREEMQDHEGDWKPFHPLADGSILQADRTVRYYSAMLHFSEDDAETIDAKIAVNHPVAFQKWRFYLMDAKDNQPYIVLSGKRDPGWPLVRAGIWMMLVGVAVMCFRKASKS